MELIENWIYFTSCIADKMSQTCKTASFDLNSYYMNYDAMNYVKL